MFDTMKEWDKTATHFPFEDFLGIMLVAVCAVIFYLSFTSNRK